MTSTSTEGIKTVLVPVSDLERAKAAYTALLGQAPQTDGPYYVGFDVAGQHIGLAARWRPAAPDLAGGLLARARHRGHAGRDDRRGCNGQGSRQRRGRRPPGGHCYRPRRQRARPDPGHLSANPHRASGQPRRGGLTGTKTFGDARVSHPVRRDNQAMTHQTSERTCNDPYQLHHPRSPRPHGCQ